MTIGQRIKNRRIELGLSVEDVAKLLSKNRATVYRYESDFIENMPLPILEPLAKVLQTTPAYLMGWEDTGKEQNGLFKYGNVSGIIPLPETTPIPLIGDIACGKPILAVENISAYLPRPDTVVADFALRCKGDSMVNARIYDGDVVYIKEQPDVESGEIAAVQVQGMECEATLKRVKKADDKIILWPENPAYEPLVFSGNEINNVRILGKAVAFLSSVR